MSDKLQPYFQICAQQNASDIFLHTNRSPAIRKNGIIQTISDIKLQEDHFELFLAEYLDAKQQDSFHQTGDLDMGYTLSDGSRFRLNISRQQGHCAIVGRLVPSGDLSFEQLNIPPEVMDLIKKPRGIVLVTGATGSGKSTTLASLVNYINQHQPLHIVTIEDPIEFVHKDKVARISQREIGSDTVSFHEALRRVVRQSPDVILIGEMRDQESIRVAMSAALTGHLVLSTVHTIDATQTLQRLMSYFPEHQRNQIAMDLSLSLNGIVSQRLVPTQDLNSRILAVELLTNTPAVGQLLRELRYQDLEDLMRSSRVPQITTFNQQLVQLTKSGKISEEIGRAYSTNSDAYNLLLQGMGTSALSHSNYEGSGALVSDIKMMLQQVQERGASDLHLCVGRKPILRIKGQLEELSQHVLSSSDIRMLLNSIMNSRQLSTYQLEKEIDFSLSLEDGQRFRVNAYFQRGHSAAALRAIPSTIPDPDLLMIPSSILSLSDKPHGLILVVGPTGSGKSTTLACMIDRINSSRSCRIITVEDPIEFTHTSKMATIDQREVQSDTKSFARALKYILRQDPDVILIGEMRDQETISAALTAAETGHLVFATLHTNDAVQTIDRIVDVFPAFQQDQIRSQLAASLLAVISQRLLQNAEYTSRIPAFEIMLGSNAIRNLIRENKMHQALSVMETSKGAGMCTMDMSLKELLHNKLITLEEVLRYAKNPKSFVRQEAQVNPVSGRNSKYRYT
jgi:pilus retraction protein PilT